MGRIRTLCEEASTRLDSGRIEKEGQEPRTIMEPTNHEGKEPQPGTRRSTASHVRWCTQVRRRLKMADRPRPRRLPNSRNASR